MHVTAVSNRKHVNVKDFKPTHFQDVKWISINLLFNVATKMVHLLVSLLSFEVEESLLIHIPS